jgi:hypothetical protein
MEKIAINRKSTYNELKMACTPEENGDSLIHPTSFFVALDNLFSFSALEEVNHFRSLAPPPSPSSSAASGGGSGRPRCSTPGCRSIGHFQGPHFSSHSGGADCPYAIENMNAQSSVPDRIQTSTGSSRMQQFENERWVNFEAASL